MKKTLTLIAVMLALPVFAALQMVDVSTLTTNTVIHVVSPGILFTNTIATNVWLNYSTEDTNALQIGDTPYQAFTKVNANFTLLAPLTNAITSLLPTNALVPSVSGNTGFIPTNSGTGGSGTTNFTLTGFVQGWTTNNELSLSGTNTVNLLITNLAIANQGGFGTNTTLVSGVSVTTTNLSVIGQTWLNNSNLFIYTLVVDYDHLNNLVPTMTGSGSPSGTVSGTGYYSGNAYWAFDGNTNDVFRMEPLPSYIQYQFTNAVLINVYAFYQNGIYTFAKDWTLSGSQDGATFVLLDTRVGYSTFLPGSNVFPITNTVAYQYYRINVTAANGTYYCTINGIKLGFQIPINVVESGYLLEILSTNGVAINTNSSGGYDFYASRIGAASVTAGTVNSDTNNTTLENATQVLSTNVSASGNVNASSFTLNGVPLSFTTNSPLTIQYFVTNGAGVAASFNGIYKYSGASSYFRSYTNSATPGYYFLNSAGWNYFDTNNNALLAQSYSSLSVLGSYNGQTDWPTNKLLVSIYTNPVAIFLLAGAGGNTDGSLLTGLNLNYRSGITNIPPLTTSQAVLFSTPFSPTVGTNYSVSVSFDTALAAAVGFSTTSKTTNGFTVTLSGTITGAVQVDYAAWPYQ